MTIPHLLDLQIGVFKVSQAIGRSKPGIEILSPRRSSQTERPDSGNGTGWCFFSDLRMDSSEAYY